MPEVSFAVSECIYAWTAAYRQDGTKLKVRIKINPDPDVDAATVAACQALWKTGIERSWSNQYDCCKQPNCTDRRAITLTVDWVTAGEHLKVRLKRGPGRSNMELWHTTDSGLVAAHEVGHLLGNKDEYEDSLCPNRNPVRTRTLMDDLSGPPAERHCERFCRDIGEIIA